MTARKPRATVPESDSIAEAVRRQALIVEHLYDGIIVTDSDGVILDWNPAAERLFGYGRAEVIGRSAELLNRPGEGPALSRAIRAGLKNGHALCLLSSFETQNPISISLLILSDLAAGISPRLPQERTEKIQET